MKTIDEDIKSGQFKKIYLLYGDEAYLKKQYKKTDFEKSVRGRYYPVW